MEVRQSMNPAMPEAARVSGWRERRPNFILTLWRVAIALALGVLLILCWRAAEVRPSVFFQASTFASVWSFLRSLFPPDLSPDFLRVVVAAIGRTLAMAMAGTALSIMIGFPLGVLATATLYRHGV